jgi:uncharacterized protein (DUF58 family)
MTLTPSRQKSPVDPQTLEAVSKLTLKTRKVIQGLQGGMHASLHLGPSVEFAEHKKYSPGDDIRHIDWRALARTDRHYVKQHQREVILRCLMMVDCSASMGYRGTRARTDKLGYGIELVAALSHILVHQGDAAGLLTFGTELYDFIPPERRPDHLSALMIKLATTESDAAGTTAFQNAIARVADKAGRRAMVVLVSDLWGAKKETEIALAQLAARGHDVAIFHILDPDEIDLPFERPLTFRDMEGARDVAVDPTLIREDYRDALTAVWNRWRLVCGESGIDFVTVQTNSTPSRILSDFIARRQTQGTRR